jgi:hypothetical protein
MVLARQRIGGTESRPHEVCTPTLTGLGERIHLMSPNINLDNHVTGIVNVIKHKPGRKLINGISLGLCLSN